MKYLALLVALLAPSIAQAKDIALVLSEGEVGALKHVLDAAVRAQGLPIAPMAVHLLERIESAPVVTDQKVLPPPAAAPTEDQNHAH